jgi:hypothetical protein
MTPRPGIATHSPEPIEIEHTFGRVALAEIFIPAGYRVPTHGHGESSVCVIVDGGFDERTRRGAQACLAGTLRYSPPDDLHQIQLRDVAMRCTVISAERDDLPASRSRLYLHSPVLAELAARLSREGSDPSKGCPLIAESMALELFAGIVRHARKRRYRHAPRWLIEIRRTLDDPSRWSLTLDELGECAGHNGAPETTFADDSSVSPDVSSCTPALQSRRSPPRRDSPTRAISRA